MVSTPAVERLFDRRPAGGVRGDVEAQGDVPPSQTASISAKVISGTYGAAGSSMEPTSLLILMKSTLRLAIWRTARRNSSGVSQTPMRPETATWSARLPRSMWPPVTHSPCPQTTSRGPSNRPEAMASRTATSANRGACKLRSVV